MKTTIKILHDEGLFERYDNADEVLKSYVSIERRGLDLEDVNDDVIQ